MTLVVLAIAANQKELVCISDSRISNSSSGNSVISDATAKMIPFTAIVNYSTHKPKRQKIEWRYDLCFCFAGSTLLANSVFALGASISRNIYSSKIKTRPTIEVVAEFFKFAFENVGRDLNSRGQRFDSEIAIFGYCKASRRVRAFTLKQKFEEDSYSVLLEEYPEKRFAIALGEKSEFENRFLLGIIKAKMTGTPTSLKELFKDVHSDIKVRGVGGGIQECYVDHNGIDIPVRLDLQDKSLKMFGVPCDSKTNYANDYTIGDIAPGAKIRSL